MLIVDLIKLIGYNKPCVYLAPRGEVEMYCIGTRTNKTAIQYELLAVVNENNAITAWYDGDEVLTDFKLLDYME